MARPKREIIPVKTHTLVVRLDDIQYSIIEKYARQLGIPMAEYVRRQATQGKVEISYPIVADIEQLQKLTDEFHAIGNNLNQIARYFNMGGLHSMAIRCGSCVYYNIVTRRFASILQALSPVHISLLPLLLRHIGYATADT